MDGAPTDRCPPFRFSARARVDVSDTDMFGIVYYGRFLPYFDGAVIAYRRHLGIELTGPPGHNFVVRHVAVSYRESAVFDDALEVFVRTARIGRTSHAIQYRVERLGSPEPVHIADGEVIFVGIDPGRRATPAPEPLRRAIVGFEGDHVEIG